jgi:hypothetical protein
VGLFFGVIGVELLLVAILIFWPGLVTNFVPKAATMDPTKIDIQLDQSSPALQPPAGGDKAGMGEPKADDSSQDIERMLRQQR